MFKKSFIIFSVIFLLIVNLIIGYTLYNLLSEKSSSKISEVSEESSVVPSMDELEGYVDYAYEIIGDLDIRMTISANILYDYSDGKINRENALIQIEEHVVATFERHSNYVPYDTSQFNPSDKIITNEMDGIVKELLDSYVELQIYMQNTLDDDILVDQEGLIPLIMPVTDYIVEINQLRDKLLNIQ